MNRNIIQLKRRNHDNPHFGEWPFAGLSLMEEFEHLFDNILRTPMLRSIDGAERVHRPPVDITEGKDHFGLSVELPGFDEKEVDISLDGKTLIIDAERSKDDAACEKSRCYQERQFGKFRRTFTLNDKIDFENIEASFSNGILAITLPKLPEGAAEVRRITIK